ncbi:MAG: hypothetical protein AB1351_07000 [Thermoproteota archaeon]
MGLELTPSLKAALTELYYKEGCDQQGWAYVPLREINLRDNILVFNKGPHKISIRLMDKIVPEIKEISRPISGNLVFDYLTCKVGQQKKYEGAMLANPTALCWVKIGKGAFSGEQIDALGRIKLPLAVFLIRNVLVQPANIEMKWDIKTGEEWLDELDDQRDQAESDDDYL